MKRLVLGVVIALLLLGGAMSAYWAWAANRFEQAVAQTAEDLRAQGYRVDYRDPEVGGFPFELTARLEGAELDGPDGLFWRAPPIGGRLQLLDPTTMEIDFSGAHRLGTAEAAVDAAFASATAVIHLRGGGQPDHLNADLADIAVRADKRPEITAARLVAQLGPWRAAAPDHLQEIDLQAEVSALSVPAGLSRALGPIIERLAADLTLHGPILGGDLEDALVLWQAVGGHLEIKSVELAWGPLALTITGDLALDPQRRPVGRLTVSAGGLPEALDLLEQDGALRADQLRNARAALKAYARLPGQSEQQVSFPLAIRQGAVYLGFLRLTRLPPVL